MDAIAHEKSEELSRALGEAVVRIWGHLPSHLQNRLFREASRDARTRPAVLDLAMFLHEKHPRTSAAVRARAIPEPDSLGG